MNIEVDKWTGERRCESFFLSFSRGGEGGKAFEY
jgi:hypothetical protein